MLKYLCQETHVTLASGEKVAIDNQTRNQIKKAILGAEQSIVEDCQQVAGPGFGRHKQNNINLRTGAWSLQVFQHPMYRRLCASRNARWAATRRERRLGHGCASSMVVLRTQQRPQGR